MQNEFAVKARDLTLEALQKLHTVTALDADWSPQDMQEFRRAVGKAIGLIDVEVLCSIYGQYPDLNDLSEEGSAQE